jgi:hypothetical protein
VLSEYALQGAWRTAANTAPTMTRMMRNLTVGLAALLLGAAGAVALAGCGGSTKTVSVAGAPAEAQTTSAPPATSTQASPPATTATSTTPPPTSTAGGAAAPGTTTTRTAPEPAFAQQESHAEGLSEAESVLKARGYTANETSQYHPNQTLRVLVGTSTASGEGPAQQAFFFVDGRYIGTDTKLPSASVTVLSQSDTEVALGYPLYRPGDPASSPSGGQAIVHFQLDNGKLTPLGQIPPASSSTGVSRH